MHFKYWLLCHTKNIKTLCTIDFTIVLFECPFVWHFFFLSTFFFFQISLAGIFFKSVHLFCDQLLLLLVLVNWHGWLFFYFSFFSLFPTLLFRSLMVRFCPFTHPHRLFLFFSLFSFSFTKLLFILQEIYFPNNTWRMNGWPFYFRCPVYFLFPSSSFFLLLLTDSMFVDSSVVLTLYNQKSTVNQVKGTFFTRVTSMVKFRSLFWLFFFYRISLLFW